MSESELIFEGAAEVSQWWLPTVVCLGAAGLIILLMRYERQLVSRGVGVALLTLRLSVLAVLMLTFLQPTLTGTLDTRPAGRVVVAVDVSESMDTADEYATNAELLRTARAMGIVGNTAFADRFDDWIAAWEAGDEPVWVSEAEGPTPQRRHELADVRRQNIEQALDAAGKLPRREIVRRLLVDSPQQLLAELQNVCDVDLRLFAASSEIVVADGAKTLLADRSSDPPRSNTDIAASLDTTTGSESSPLAGVVIFSDGRHTAASDPVEVASRLGLLGVPVIPVLIGSDQQPRDISIQSVEHPQIVFRNDSLSIRVRAFATGYSGEELNLTLTHPDGTRESQILTVPETGAPLLDTQFTMTTGETGRRDYQLAIDRRTDEARADNNTQSISINVIDDHANVLLIDSEARWEFRFLQTALERDERINVTPVVFKQPYLGVLPDTFFSRDLPFDALQFDQQQSPLSDFDLIIVGDVSPTEFDANAWAVVEHWVRDLGGTLVLAAGREAMPRAHESPSLDRLLPISDLQNIQINDVAPTALPDDMGFRLALTVDGADEEFLRLDADAQSNRRLWKSLPGHLWGLTGSARPTATVLLSADGLPESARVTQPSSLTPLRHERQSGILVHQYFGFGQVLWLGIDSTWRWRHRRGDELHHRFWGQIARWATRNRTSSGNDVVRLSLSDTTIEPGERVTVRARWQQRFLEQHPRLKAAVEFSPAESSSSSLADGRKPSGPNVTSRAGSSSDPTTSRTNVGTESQATSSAASNDETSLRVDLVPNQRQPEVFEAAVPALAPGAWVARLVVEDADLDPPVETGLLIAQPRTAESADLTANRDLLTRIAAASANGRLLLPDQVDEIIPLLNLPTDATAVRQVLPVWNHWLVMLAIFACLTTEWTLRKLNGLP